MRVETTGGRLLPSQSLDLNSAPVAPAGQSAQGTCPGDSIVGAVNTATHGDWNGTWSDDHGWSIDRIYNVDLAGSATKSWLPYVNNAWVNNDPCHAILGFRDSLLLYPKCTTNSVDFCFTGEPMWIYPYQAIAGPGERVKLQAYEVHTSFDGGSHAGTSSLGPSPDAVFATV